MEKLMSQYGSTIITMLGGFGIMYFLFYRPNKKNQDKRQKMYNELQVGKDVVTAGGIFGTIETMGDDFVVLRVAKGASIKFKKASISYIVE